MFEHILLAVDGSAHAKSAIPAASEIAKRFNGDIFVSALKAVEQTGVSAKGEVQHAAVGHAARHIVDTARQRGSNMK